VFAVRPVQADDVQPSSSDKGLVTQLEIGTYGLVNSLVAAVPFPADWKNRHVCFGVDEAGRAWCLFVPFPY
jgi:hypothetical protein